MPIQWSELIEYSVESVKSKVASMAGVYRLSARDDAGEYRVFYVGQANDLRARLLQHLGDGEPNECIRTERKKPCKFRIVYVERQEGMDQVESETIQEFSPRCNAKKP